MEDNRERAEQRAVMFLVIDEWGMALFLHTTRRGLVNSNWLAITLNVRVIR